MIKFWKQWNCIFTSRSNSNKCQLLEWDLECTNKLGYFLPQFKFRRTFTQIRTLFFYLKDFYCSLAHHRIHQMQVWMSLYTPFLLSSDQTSNYLQEDSNFFFKFSWLFFYRSLVHYRSHKMKKEILDSLLRRNMKDLQWEVFSSSISNYCSFNLLWCISHHENDGNDSSSRCSSV